MRPALLAEIDHVDGHLLAALAPCHDLTAEAPDPVAPWAQASIPPAVERVDASSASEHPSASRTSEHTEGLGRPLRLAGPPHGNFEQTRISTTRTLLLDLAEAALPLCGTTASWAAPSCSPGSATTGALGRSPWT